MSLQTRRPTSGVTWQNLLEAAEKVPSLFMYGMLFCPMCEEYFPLQDYVTFRLVAKYAYAVVPIYKCHICGHIYAPVPNYDEHVQPPLAS